MRIERSMEAYWRNKGKLLCSSCLDRQNMHQEATEDSREDGSSGFRDNGNKS
jgi:hypothetical protein